MATRHTPQSARSEYSPSPRRKGKGDLPEEPPGIMVCIHVLRPMAEPKKRGPKQREAEGHDE